MIRVIFLALSSALLSGCFSQQAAPSVDRSLTSQAKANAPVQPSGPGYYTVKRGDTLYRIALEHGQDYKDVAAWNNVTNPSSISEGQVLRVAPPAGADGSGVVVAKPIETGAVIESRPLDQPPPVPVAKTTLKTEPRVGKEPYSDEAYARLNKTDAPAKNDVVVPPVAPPVATGPDDLVWMWPVPGNVVSPFSEGGNKGLNFAGRAGDPVFAAGDGKVVYAGAGLRGYGELLIVKHNATYLSAYAHNRKILVKEGQQVSRGQKIAEMGSTDTDSVKLHFEIRKQGKPVDPAPYLPKR